MVDVNRDGKMDLLIGERSGNLNYFENTGTTAAPVFSSGVATFGGVNVTKATAVAGYSVPLMFDSAGVYRLLVGSESGFVYEYGNIDNNLTGNFTLIDSMYQNIYEPKRVTISRADYDGDGKQDLITGNTSGGMRIYSQYTAVGLIEQPDPAVAFDLSPNPATDYITFRFMQPNASGKRLIQIMDVLGNTIDKFVNNEQAFSYTISMLPKGLYLAKISAGNHTFTSKFVK
jgi:hypothetical protein